MNVAKKVMEYILNFIKGRFGDLLAGFVFWLPIGVIVLIVSYIYGNLEDLGATFLLLFLPEDLLRPGYGIILWIAALLLTGLILKNTAIGDFLSRVPIVGLFFRRKGGTVITFGRLLNLTPCLFLYSPTCLSYGWILSEEKVQIRDKKGLFTLINIYYPNVPSILTGQIFPVRKETVIKLGNPSKEIIDLLLYALRSPENIQYLPWEDEKEEEFEKRAELFGLKRSVD